MKILLIQPRMNKRPMDTALKAQMAPSLALLTIANILRGHDVTIINENIESTDFNQQADIIGITVTVDVMPRAAEISRRFRDKGIFVVAGGIHITANPEDTEAYFDAVCLGAAEKTWPALINDFRKGCPQKRYACDDDLTGDGVVSPAYDLIERSGYLYVNVVSTSRGCPYRCSFCYNSAEAFRTSYINRPVADVVADIQAIGTKHVMFIDDNFIGNPAWTREFLNAIAPMGLKWNAAVSSNIAAMPELLDLMKETGCQSLFIGFESLNSESLKSVNKKQNSVEKYENLIDEIHKRGIMINASFVFGLDGDDRTMFKTTLDWIVKNRIETITSHILTPFPGTKLYEELCAQNRIIDFNLEKYNTAHVVYLPKSMSAKELYDGYIWIYKELYSFRNIIKRMPKAKNQRIPFLAFNFLYRKYGRFTEKLCRLISFNNIGRFARFISYKI
jgi:radical SAM superfamily enzyme YgiQ (UPF0313 family)